ncbi:MAG: VOC family protein [Verrucomicrobiales bacterium]
MRDPNNVFHLAIPCRDLQEAKGFYVDGLGCRLAREYDDRITLDFFGDQLVLHLAPDEIDPDPKMYPRHFGATFCRKEEFDSLLATARERNLRFFQELNTRFGGLREEHFTFFLIDPSNNLLEFKFYHDPEMIY